MPYYLVQMSYTTEAIRTLEEHPHNRFEELRPVYEEFGDHHPRSLPGLWGLRRSIAA